MYACKRYMCVDIKSRNASVPDDSGRFPLHIENAKRCIKYWIRILKIKKSKIGKTKCYNMVRYFDELGYNN